VGSRRAASRRGGPVLTFLTTFWPYTLNSKRLSWMHNTVGATSMAMLLAARTRQCSLGHLYLFAPCKDPRVLSLSRDIPGRMWHKPPPTPSPLGSHLATLSRRDGKQYLRNHDILIGFLQGEEVRCVCGLCRVNETSKPPKLMVKPTPLVPYIRGGGGKWQKSLRKARNMTN